MLLLHLVCFVGFTCLWFALYRVEQWHKCIDGYAIPCEKVFGYLTCWCEWFKWNFIDRRCVTDFCVVAGRDSCFWRIILKCGTICEEFGFMHVDILGVWWAQIHNVVCGAIVGQIELQQQLPGHSWKFWGRRQPPRVEGGRDAGGAGMGGGAGAGWAPFLGLSHELIIDH